MIRATVATIAEILGASCVATEEGRTQEVAGVSIDSRSLQAGELFFALVGEKSDGHLYLASAAERGAAAAVIERSRLAELKPVDPQGESRLALIGVDSVAESLLTLARWWRQGFGGQTLAITGSSGKTSSRDMATALLRSIYGEAAVDSTRGNLNNHLGLPLTILRSRQESAWWVVELGMNHSGEIDALTQLARPDHALITSISGAHRQFFTSIEEIARAKLEIVNGLSAGRSTLHFPAASPYIELARRIASEAGVELRSFAAGSVRLDRDGLHFEWRGHSLSNRFYFNHVMADNFVGVLELLAAAAVERSALSQAVAAVRPTTPNRFERFDHPSGSILIDDSYNANPDSFDQALRAAAALAGPSGRWALLAGEMGELGCDSIVEHGAIGREAVRLGVGAVVAVGKAAAAAVAAAAQEEAERLGRRVVIERHENSSVAAAEESLLESLLEYDLLLVKGSRSAHMELLSAALKEKGYV